MIRGNDLLCTAVWHMLSKRFDPVRLAMGFQPRHAPCCARLVSVSLSSLSPASMPLWLWHRRQTSPVGHSMLTASIVLMNHSGCQNWKNTSLLVLKKKKKNFNWIKKCNCKAVHSWLQVVLETKKIHSEFNGLPSAKKMRNCTAQQYDIA